MYVIIYIFLYLVFTFCFNCFRFGDKLVFDVENSLPHTIPVTAIGRGTTIVSDPPMTSIVDIGPQFSRTLYTKQVVLTHRGRRHQSLVWSTEGFRLRVLRKSTSLQATNTKDVKNKVFI